MRRAFALLVLVGGPLLYLARRHRRPRQRVHVHYDDGSMVTVERGRPEAQRLLALAHDAL
jgi:hypothetical protein